jgi:hypothetical protein
VRGLVDRSLGGVIVSGSPSLHPVGAQTPRSPADLVILGGAERGLDRGLFLTAAVVIVDRPEKNSAPAGGMDGMDF